MTFRAVLAIILCKALRLFSRLVHRGGTAMPGRFALRVCPDLLAILARDVKSVAITGTNGKTTSSRMIEEAFAGQGYRYFANRSGANLISGITTEFVMNCTLGGKMKKEYAVTASPSCAIGAEIVTCSRIRFIFSSSSSVFLTSVCINPILMEPI